MACLPATTPNRSTAWDARTPRSTGSAFGRACRVSTRASREQVVEQAANPLSTRCAGRRSDTNRGPILGQGQAGMGLDHRQRCSQLVGGIGRELELASAGQLDRRAPAGRRQGAETRASGVARSATVLVTIRVDRAWETKSRFRATITRSSPAVAPAIRTSTPLTWSSWDRSRDVRCGQWRRRR